MIHSIIEWLLVAGLLAIAAALLYRKGPLIIQHNHAAAGDHQTDIVLLGVIAVGVMILMGIGQRTTAADKSFDPSAYLVVLTLIVSAMKEKWTTRSAERQNASAQGTIKDLGNQLSTSVPGNGGDPAKVEVTNTAKQPIPTKTADEE